MKKLLYITYVCAMFVVLQSCASVPKGFVKATDGGSWSSIYIREELPYDRAFNEVLDVIAKRFEMDMIQKDGGYGRTQWIYTWNPKSKYDEKYRTRVIFKFSADRSIVDIKTEAETAKGNYWIRGFDSQLLQTVKQDVMGAVGRTVL